MTFTSKELWLYQNREYIEIVERVIEESIACDELEDAMFVFRAIPEDRETLAKQRAQYKAAIEARRDVLSRLLEAHSKGGEHVESQ